MEKSVNQPDIDAPAVTPTALPECLPPKEKHRTVGNIIYDFGVFGSVAWAGVALLSLLSAHEAMHGRHKWFGWLRSLNDNVSSGLSKTLSKTILKNAPKETVEGYAKGTTMFLTLGMGGNALMAPVKWLEDNRQKNAAHIDNFLGTTPPDPKTIAHEPKQTWKSVFSGRMTSWGLSYAAFLAMGPRITGQVSHWFGDKFTHSWMKMRPASNPVTVKRWADIGAFDVLFTMITASATYLISRYVARKDEKKLGIEDELFEINTAAPRGLEPLFDGHQPGKQFASTIARKNPTASSELFTQKYEGENNLGHIRS